LELLEVFSLTEWSVGDIMGIASNRQEEAVILQNKKKRPG